MFLARCSGSWTSSTTTTCCISGPSPGRAASRRLPRSCGSRSRPSARRSRSWKRHSESVSSSARAARSCSPTSAAWLTGTRRRSSPPAANCSRRSRGGRQAARRGSPWAWPMRSRSWWCTVSCVRRPRAPSRFRSRVAKAIPIELVAQLATHSLDVVISDTPAAPHLRVKSLQPPVGRIRDHVLRRETVGAAPAAAISTVARRRADAAADDQHVAAARARTMV